MVKRALNILLLLLVFNPQPLLAQKNYKHVGCASYYHDKFEGRKTSSGEKFRQKKLTCAHRTLPFGTKLRVTNLANDKEVMVTVNDRGPFAKGRIIDLTKAAAKELDFVRSGHTKVAIEVVGDLAESLVADSEPHHTFVDDEKSIPGRYAVQVGNFANRNNIERLTSRMKRELDKQVFVRLGSGESDKTYRVMVGKFDNRNEAFGYLDRIITYYPGAFIVKLREEDD